MDTWLPIVIQLVAGALGGNLAGSRGQGSGMGATGNTLAGAAGGLGLAQLLQLLGLGAGGGALDVGSLLTSVLGGGVGGGVLTAILGAVMGGTRNATCASRPSERARCPEVPGASRAGQARESPSGVTRRRVARGPRLGPGRPAPARRPAGPTGR